MKNLVVLYAVVLSLNFLGCSQNSSGSGSPENPHDDSKISQIDFPITMPHMSSNDLFEESVNLQIGFSAYQYDQKLRDLFSSKNTSELCGPTSVANLLALLYYSPTWNLNNLKFAATPTSGQYTDEVRALYDLCGTDSNSGTRTVNMRQCILSTLQNSGYLNSSVKVTGALRLSNPPPSYETITNPVDVDDIRNAFKEKAGIIMEVDFYDYDSTKGRWIYKYGHFLLIVGYDYDPSFDGNSIILKVVDPLTNYAGRSPYNRYDDILMLRYPKKDSEIYPSQASFILDGYNLKGIDGRGFVSLLIKAYPQN